MAKQMLMSLAALFTAVLFCMPAYAGRKPCLQNPEKQKWAETTLRLGQEKKVKTPAGPVSIKAVSIVEDSRCPSGLKCISYGSVVVRLELSWHSDPKTTDTPDIAQGANVLVRGVRFTLFNVKPYPSGNGIPAIRPQDYTIRVTLDFVGPYN